MSAATIPHGSKTPGGGANDPLIAAIAQAHDLTLLIHNTKAFSRIPDLSGED